MLKKLTEDDVRDIVMQFRGAREAISDDVFLKALAYYDEFLNADEHLTHNDRTFAAFLSGYVAGKKGGL